MTAFITAMFMDEKAGRGLNLLGGPLLPGQDFRERVSVGDEAFCWAVIDNWIQSKQRNTWSSSKWYDLWTTWGDYVGEKRADKDYTFIENEAIKVSCTMHCMPCLLLGGASHCSMAVMECSICYPPV
jgi:hypothetical protein